MDFGNLFGRKDVNVGFGEVAQALPVLIEELKQIRNSIEVICIVFDDILDNNPDFDRARLDAFADMDEDGLLDDEDE